MRVVAGHALRESLRRRVFVVVLVVFAVLRNLPMGSWLAP